MPMVGRILVAGGAGYIGGAVTDWLLKRSYDFDVYDNLIYESQFLKPVNFIRGDIRNKKLLKKILPNYTHVIWLAALVGDGACAIKPKLTEEFNEKPVAWLAKNFSGRIIFTSTCSVYGINPDPVTEESLTGPLSVYAATKLAAEKQLADKNALIFRLGTAFGLSDTYSRTRMDLAVNYMTMNAIRYGKLTVKGGKQWRPFAHVKDIGKVIVDNIDTKHMGIFNFAPQNEQIFKVAKKIQKHTHCDVEITELKSLDERSYFADVSKGLKAGVFSDKTDYAIDFGITEIKDLVLSNRVKDLEEEYYSNEKYLLQSLTEKNSIFIGN
jgi:nucleoside-diphosphate-sugar epimerase